MTEFEELDGKILYEYRYIYYSDYSFWRNEFIEPNEIKYKELYEKYNEYIKMIAELLEHISYDNSISKYAALSFLYHIDVFSDEPEIEKEIKTNLGIYTLSGKGVCRHLSYFTKNIFDELNINCEIFPCSLSTDSEKITLLGSSDHLANEIEYKGKAYIADVYNFDFHKFDSMSVTKSIDETNPTCFHYKPKTLMEYDNYSITEIMNKAQKYEESVNDTISIDEYNEIEKSTYNKLLSEMPKIAEFKEKSKVLTKKISNLTNL